MNEFDTEKAIKAVTNTTRLQIIKYLQTGPSCVTKALDQIDLSQPNLSQHLRKLKQAGIVDCKIRGSERCYFICRPTFVDGLIKLLTDKHEYIPCSKPEQE